MRKTIIGLILGVVLLAGTPVVQAHPPASVQRFPSVGGTSNVPIYGAGVPSYGYGYGLPYGGYGVSTYASPFSNGYRSSSYYATPFGYSNYNNTGVTATPFGYSYYQNSGYRAPGFGGGYSRGVTVTPWYTQTYGYGY